MSVLQEDKEQPEKGEEEAKGVEMEGDFEGDLFDLPSDAENDDEEGEQGEDNEERLDQEMGEVGQEGQVGFAWADLRPASLPTCTNDAAVIVFLAAAMVITAVAGCIPDYTLDYVSVEAYFTRCMACWCGMGVEALHVQICAWG